MYSKLAPSVFLTLLLTITNGQSTNYEARATFSRYAMGSVSVINGHVMVDLDVSNVGVGNNTLGIPGNCFNNGVYYHIHSQWNHDDMMDYQGTANCGNLMTGGHWDPTFACSPNSDAVDCRDNGGCIWGSSAVEVNGSYQCNEDTWDSHGYSCEVSDFSGKYGMANVNGNDKISVEEQHWMELDGIDFDDDYSIVFHCGDGTRAFCAPFNVTMREDTNYQREMGKDKATIDFGNFKSNDVNFKGTEITIGNGWVEVDIPDSVGKACTTWFVRVYGGWEHSSSSPQVNDMCTSNYTWGVWDPTHSCIDESDSMYCQDGTRCPGTTATDVNYACDNGDDALRCAIGDITGRIDEINTGNGKYNEMFEDRVSMHIDQLAGKSLVMECTRIADITENGIYRVCTRISSSDLSLNGKSGGGSSSTDDGELTGGGVVAIILVIIVFIGIGVAMWRGKPSENSNNPRLALAQQTVLGSTVVSTSTGDMNISGPIITEGDGQKPTDNNNDMVMRVDTVSNLDTEAVEVSPSPKAPPLTTTSTETNEIHETAGGHGIMAVPQGYETAGKLPPPPKHMSMSESKKEDIDLNDNNNDNNNNEDEGNDNENGVGGENAEYLSDNEENNNNNNNYSTPNGLPSKPEHGNGNVNNDNYNNNGQREDTPDQPMTDFEDENGALPNELLGNENIDI